MARTIDNPERIGGIDSIRFVLACVVTIGHLGLFPLLEGIETSSKAGWLLHGLYGATMNGPAAVILFFIISGFCIHYPYRGGERLRLLRYYPRRYLRILVPLALGIGIARLAGVAMPMFGESILWSIVCEEVYYLLYPLLLLFRRKNDGWAVPLLLAFLGATVVAWTNPKAGDYASYGWQLNWLLGLPCWLLGCILAERSESLRSPVSRRAIWSWRLAVWLTSGALLALRFHSPVGYPHTFNYFAILGYFWLRHEVRYFRHVRPSRILEWGGKWSYSLYLLHVPAGQIYWRLTVPNLGFIVNWFCRFGWTLGGCYVFYLLVEKPSHTFARWVGRREQGSVKSRSNTKRELHQAGDSKQSQLVGLSQDAAEGCAAAADWK